MELRRKVVGGVALMMTSALPVLADVPAAGADDFYLSLETFEHTFDGLDGQPRTCTVTASSGLTRRSGQSTFTADSLTAILDEEGCTGFTTLSASYHDASGTLRHVTASGDNEVSVTVDGVHNSWVARHGVTFDDCASNCFVTVDTQPK